MLSRTEAIVRSLLANWSNAMLNTIEGVTLPVYMNGVKATAQSMLPLWALRSQRGPSDAGIQTEPVQPELGQQRDHGSWPPVHG